MPGDRFNRFAKIYDRLISPRDTIPWINELSSKKQPFLIDLGGGTGRLIPQFLTVAKRIVLADHSFQMLRSSKFKNHPQVSCVCCDLTHLPFDQSGRMNMVMVDTLHHVYEPKEVICSIVEWIGQDCVFIIEEPDIKFFFIKLIALGERLLGMKSKFYPQKEICGWIDAEIYVASCNQDGNNFYLLIQKRKSSQ